VSRTPTNGACIGKTLRKLECTNYACKCYRGALEALVGHEQWYVHVYSKQLVQ